MNRLAAWRHRLAWACAWALLWAVAPGLALAGVTASSPVTHGSQLMRNPQWLPAIDDRPSEPPRDTFHGVSYDPSVGRARREGDGVLQVSYRRVPDGPSGMALEISLLNRAPQAANYTFNLATQRVPLGQGDTHTLKAVVSVQGLAEPMQVALGFQFYKADGSYLSDMAPHAGEYQPSLPEGQSLLATHVAGALDPSSGAQPASYLPRLALYNLPPGASVRLRLSQVQWHTVAPLPGVSALPLPQPVPDQAPGSVWPFTVQWTGPALSKPVRPRITLRDERGSERVFEGAQSLTADRPGLQQDVWALRVPEALPAGRHSVWYSLPGVLPPTRIAEVQITPRAGMWVGMAIHRYPGSSEAMLGPYQGRYQFVRSLASDEAHRMQWWLGPDQYDWTGLDRWARFHAKPGQRKLIMTFSGSPTWASASPKQYAAMGIPGNAAPPTQALRGAYQRMVRETVRHLKGRLLATECWNEPNSPDFFTGTQTDLADLCQSVFEATKAVDARIAVICPQADDPSHLDFVYGARTSSGEPIQRHCDWVGAHLYNRLGQDTLGRDFARQRIADGIALMRDMGRKHGIDKPLAVTEFGLSSCVLQPTPAHPTVLGRMDSNEAGEALYRAVAAFREAGVGLLGLYSYDHPNNDPQCRPGGSFIRMTLIDRNGDLRIDPVVAQKVSQSVQDFGRVGDD